MAGKMLAETSTGRDLNARTKELGCYLMFDRELIKCFTLDSVMTGVWLGSSL